MITSVEDECADDTMKRAFFISSLTNSFIFLFWQANAIEQGIRVIKRMISEKVFPHRKACEVLLMRSKTNNTPYYQGLVGAMSDKLIVLYCFLYNPSFHL